MANRSVSLARSPGAIVARLRPKLAAINQAVAFPFNLPPIQGLGNTGGFQYLLEALQGQPAADIAAVTRAMLVASNQQPELAGVFSTSAADTPQVYLNVDRNKAQVLGVGVADLFNALQSTIGRFSSMTSTRSAAFDSSTCRPTPRSGVRSTTFSTSMSVPRPARWFRSACWANPRSCRGRSC